MARAVCSIPNNIYSTLQERPFDSRSSGQEIINIEISLNCY